MPTGLQHSSSAPRLPRRRDRLLSTRPAGSASGVALTTQPVIEILDAAGNLVPAADATVTATIATGGGTITGSTATAVAGVATFNGMTISGTIGDRTITFSSGALAPVTSIGLPLSPGLPSRLTIRTQPLGAVTGLPLIAQPVIEIRDAAGNLATTYSGAVSATLGNGIGDLSNATATASRGVAAFTQLGITGPPGELTLAFTAGGLPSVSSAPFTLYPTIAAARAGLGARFPRPATP